MYINFKKSYVLCLQILKKKKSASNNSALLRCKTFYPFPGLHFFRVRDFRDKRPEHGHRYDNSHYRSAFPTHLHRRRLLRLQPQGCSSLPPPIPSRRRNRRSRHRQVLHDRRAGRPARLLRFLHLNGNTWSSRLWHRRRRLHLRQQVTMRLRIHMHLRRRRRQHPIHKQLQCPLRLWHVHLA